MEFSVGTHNLYDSEGEPTLFADIIVFTEAVAARILAVTKGTKYRVNVCTQQPDLVVVFNTEVALRPENSRTRYTQYVDGVAKVSPNRGTYTVPLRFWDSDRLLKLNAEHRINAAFPPYVRGEAEFRRASWVRHTAGTVRKMKRQASEGYATIGAGDCNTPPTVAAYPTFHEVGKRLDRIGSNLRLGDAEYLSRVGSDHPRLLTQVQMR